MSVGAFGSQASHYHELLAPEISRSPALPSGTRYLQICESRHCLRRRLPDTWKLACFVAWVSASDDCLFCAVYIALYKCTGGCFPIASAGLPGGLPCAGVWSDNLNRGFIGITILELIRDGLCEERQSWIIVISGRIDIIVSDTVRIYSNNRFLVTDVMSHYAFCLIIRPHNKHSVHTMRPIATDGVALSVRLSVGHVRELSFQVDTRNHVVGGGHDRTNPFAAARGDKSVARPFVKILWLLVIIIIIMWSKISTQPRSLTVAASNVHCAHTRDKW